MKHYAILTELGLPGPNSSFSKLLPWIILRRFLGEGPVADDPGVDVEVGAEARPGVDVEVGVDEEVGAAAFLFWSRPSTYLFSWSMLDLGAGPLFLSQDL